MVRATDGCGKTDDPRPVNRRKYEENHVRIFGIKCPKGWHCEGCFFKNDGKYKSGKIYYLNLYNEILKIME